MTDEEKEIEKQKQKQLEIEAAKDDLKTFDLEGVEIMAPGTWYASVGGKVKITVADIDNMVVNFDKIGLSVPLKFGHPDKQNFAQNEGLPALGYIKKLYRKGERMVGDFFKMPKAVHQLIKSGAYNKISAEWIKNYSLAGNVYGNVITAIALLGDQLPAVQSLKDMIDLYGADSTLPIMAFNQDYPADKVFKAIENDGKEKIEMDQLEEVKLKLAAEQEKSTLLMKEKETLQEENAKAHNANVKASIDAEIDKGVVAFKIAPAIRDTLAALAYKAAGLVEKTYKFSEGNDQKELDVENVSGLIVKLSEALPKLGNTEARSDKGEEKKKDDKEDVATEGKKEFSLGKTLDEKAKKYAKENDVPYGDALMEVADEAKEA